jgi:hypothetical protein
MGSQSSARCLNCGKSFNLDEGGGFFFHLLRCNKCGKTKSIKFDGLGELHVRYIKGLQGPYCIASAEHDGLIQREAKVEPISEKEYYKGISAIVGKCACGGKFTINARPRCPKCRSTRIDKGEITKMYD